MKIPDETTERARRVPIATIGKPIPGLRPQGNDLVSPCPWCGDGDDRFWINTQKNIWGNRCSCAPVKGADSIEFAKSWLKCDFEEAVYTVLKEPPPKKANGHDRDEPAAKKVVVERYDYHDENGKLLFQVERVQYKKPDGSWVLSNIKPKKTFRQR